MSNLKKCERCGTLVNHRESAPLGSKYTWGCGKCYDEIKSMKRQEKEAKRAEKERKAEISAEKDAIAQEKGYSSHSAMIWHRVGVVLKWIFFFLWGGIYLLVKGIQNKSKVWIIVGAEFIVFTIGLGITANLLPEGHDLYWINYLFVVPVLINLVPLIYYIKNEE